MAWIVRLGAPGGTGHQGGKDASLVRLARRQYFRVPLHTDDKCVAGAFDAFDDAVAGYGIDDQAAAQSLDRLVVRRIDLGMSAPDNFT